jgi:hypothetical protein
MTYYFCLNDFDIFALTFNVEVIQAEIVGHGDLYLCAMLLTVHDKLTCEASSTWTTNYLVQVDETSHASLSWS